MSTNPSPKPATPEEELKSNEENTEEPPIKVQKTENNTIDEPNLNNQVSELNKTSAKLLSEDESKPCISIQFENDTIADLYKEKFLNFIKSFVELQVRSEGNCYIGVFREEVINSVTSQEEGVLDDSPTSKKRKKHSKTKKELFVVDANPSPNSTNFGLKYTSKFTINKEKAVETPTNQSRQSCFNCNEFHALKDCPHPKDYAKINAARAARVKSLPPKSLRYHLEEDQKFSHIVPGKISHELRKALGLMKHEAPHYIYLMRNLGYPPGWLEEAKIVNSNLRMFGVDGNNVKNGNAQKRGLDVMKVVEYPGFNVPFDAGVKDDYRTYRVPPYSEDFSKEAMINFFDKKFVQELDDLETCDMELEQGSEEKVSRKSPSLGDLEQQKQQILEKLNEDPKVDAANSSLNKSVKTSCFGTPILKSNSPYMSLPNPDNFSKDVSPVINFENLPNSTGKYEQMTDVLQKVRTTLKKINECSS